MFRHLQSYRNWHCFSVIITFMDSLALFMDQRTWSKPTQAEKEHLYTKGASSQGHSFYFFFLGTGNVLFTVTINWSNPDLKDNKWKSTWVQFYSIKTQKNVWKMRKLTHVLKTVLVTATKSWSLQTSNFHNLITFSHLV